MHAIALACLLSSTGAADRPVVLRDGVLRWADDGSEVALFGVNYYAPFSISYRSLRDLGLDHRKVIDQDVAHFVRLGLDAIRLHCWDREMSDAQGNLLDNEHLELLDYLLGRCKESGIYAVLTAMAWWGTPEGDVGFASRFPMHQMTTDPEAWECQRRYLAQFVSHVNRYTKLAYQDDPVVVAFEPINEPIFPPGTGDDRVVEYINTLVDAIRGAGCRKPVFLNSWGGRNDALARSRADGPITGWYPSGLVSGGSLWSNFLPRVAHYDAVASPSVADRAKLVYEFDAADIPGSYIYPAMARSFREAGVQIATQFQYDCLPVAPYNLNWQTHYLNLVYAPAKTMSFAIAAEAFRSLPRGKGYGDYPESSRFGDCRVSYEEDLSEFVSATRYLYSNDTATEAPSPGELEHVWGCGSSPLVEYDGTGAYFLDRVSRGVWRVEVFPDAVWVADPYGLPDLGREVSRLIWASREMTVRLPDLGLDFHAARLAPTRAEPVRAEGGKVALEPGVWVFARDATQARLDGEQRFVCPSPVPASGRQPAAWLMVPRLWRPGAACPVAMNAALDAGAPLGAEVWVLADDGRITRVPVPRTRAYRFEGDIPAEAVRGDRLGYAVALQDADGWQVLPVAQRLSPESLTEVAARRVNLWEPGGPEVPALQMSAEAPGKATARLEETDDGPALRVEATEFGPAPDCVGLSLPIEPVEGVQGAGWALCVEGRSLRPQTHAIEVSIRQANGTALGCNMPLSPLWEEQAVPLTQLRHMWGTSGDLDLTQATQLTVVFGAWLYPSTYSLPHGFEIRRVYLRPMVTYDLQLMPDVGVLPLVGVPGLAEGDVRQRPHEPAVSIAEGSGSGRRALRFVGGPFGEEPSCVALRYHLGAKRTPREIEAWRRQLAEAREVVIVARGGQPNTTVVEIVFLEEDGTPWGINLPLGTQWRETRIGLGDLKHWSHWQTGARNRGGEGDRLDPARVDAVNICFGAWLYGEHRDEAHIVDIELIGLAP